VKIGNKMNGLRGGIGGAYDKKDGSADFDDDADFSFSCGKKLNHPAGSFGKDTKAQRVSPAVIFWTDIAEAAENTGHYFILL
jgi:hypothetical protein